MFGLGFPEIIFILLLATIILGPEHMPRAARMIGRWSAKMRSAATSFEQAIANDQDLKDVKSDIQEIKSELKSDIDETKAALNTVRNEFSAAGTDTQKAFEQAREELKEFQASTGRSDIAPDDSTPAPAPSAFMSRPLGCMSRQPASPPTEPRQFQHISLLPPKLLPGDLSRLVSRKRIQLPDIAPHSNSGTGIRLELPCKSAPILKIRHLPKPGVPHPGTQKIVHLPAISKH